MNKGKATKPPSNPKQSKTGKRRGHTGKGGESMTAGAFEERESENASGPRVPKRLDAGGPRGSR